jgi:hypothetical protein
MRTVRILDLRRRHLTAGFVPQLRVGSFQRSDSEGCTIVTIVRHSPDQLSNGPLYMCIYVRSTRTRARHPPESFCCIESIVVFTPTPPRTAVFCVSGEVLANYSHEEFHKMTLVGVKPFTISKEAF